LKKRAPAQWEADVLHAHRMLNDAGSFSVGVGVGVVFDFDVELLLLFDLNRL
jgi:hypothetical protein